MTQLLSNISIENKSNEDTKVRFATSNLDASDSASDITDSSSIFSSSDESGAESYDDEFLSPAYDQLIKAITNGNLGMVKQMIDFGLNVNHIYDRERNFSFLHLACLMGHSKIIKFLLDCGANANFVTADGHQPIDFIESDDLNTISYMLIKMQK